MKKIGLFLSLLIYSTFLAGCTQNIPNSNLKIHNEISEEKRQHSFTAIVQNPYFYQDTSIIYVYDSNNSGLPTDKGIKIASNGYDRGDILQIEFDGNIDCLDCSSFASIQNIVSTKKIGNIKDSYFIQRNNIPYELQYSGYQTEPIIETFVYKGELDDGTIVKNETGYTFTFNDLGLKISTPLGWRYKFPTADPYNLFVRNGVEIRKTGTEGKAPWTVEYIKIYAKDPAISLKETIEEKHLNPGCKLESGVVINAFSGIEGTGYYIINGIDDGIYHKAIAGVKCFPDDEDDYSIVGEAHIQFFQPENDTSRYYKVRFQDHPSIFGKIETI